VTANLRWNAQKGNFEAASQTANGISWERCFLTRSDGESSALYRLLKTFVLTNGYPYNWMGSRSLFDLSANSLKTIGLTGTMV